MDPTPPLAASLADVVEWELAQDDNVPEHPATELLTAPSNVAPANPGLPDSSESSTLDTVPEAESSSAAKSLPAAPKLKSSLTRRWTNNEQLMVSCCGVIKSRGTFYEAESLSNAYVSHPTLFYHGPDVLTFYQRFVLATFPPHFPRSLPSYLFYDNNCLFLKHLRAIHDVYITGSTGLPVDVFHAVNKHKDSDLFCQMNCNPAGFRELYTADNQWIFNSSAAEQANVWFGKFLAIVREMSEVHFNFFLDEMIIIYNEEVVARLDRTGKCPRLVPVDELALPRFS